MYGMEGSTSPLVLRLGSCLGVSESTQNSSIFWGIAPKPCSVQVLEELKLNEIEMLFEAALEGKNYLEVRSARAIAMQKNGGLSARSLPTPDPCPACGKEKDPLSSSLCCQHLHGHKLRRCISTQANLLCKRAIQKFGGTVEWHCRYSGSLLKVRDPWVSSIATCPRCDE